MKIIFINFIVKGICLQNLWNLPIKPQGSLEKFEHHCCVPTQATNWSAMPFYTLTELSLFQLHIFFRMGNGVTMPGDTYSWRKNIFLFVICFLHQQLLSYVCPEMAGDESFISYVCLPIHAPNGSVWENAMPPKVLIQLMKNGISG